MSLITLSAMLLTAGLSLAWLAWTLWGKISPSKSLPGIPLVEFSGDNSRERYTSDAGSLLGKGYDTVSDEFCIVGFFSILFYVTFILFHVLLL